MNPLLRIGRLQYESLVSYLETGNIYFAADKIHITPGTMWKDLAAIKRKLGLNPRDKNDEETLRQYLSELRKEASYGERHQGSGDQTD